MPSPACPNCKRPIPPDDINVGKDVAYCRACSRVHSFSRLAQGMQLEDGLDIARPPDGAWQQTDGMGTLVGATHRSLPSAIGMLAVSLFWNGIVSVFVLVAISSTLHLLHIPVPEWFPAPTMNDQTMGTGITIFLWIFLTPFIAIGAGMIIAFLMALAGRTEIIIGRSDASIFTGIGPLGYRRHFDPTLVTDVRIDQPQSRWRSDDGRPSRCIVIENSRGKQITCGSSLGEARRKFVAASLRKLLVR